MYIPKHYLQTDKAAIAEFMQKYSFATIISANDNKPVATHLPVLTSEEEGEFVLMSHFAKANPHAETIFNGPVLTIFAQPHAYISPKFYENEQNVPTWNYMAVHAYGNAVPINEDEGKLQLLEKTVITYEEAYLKQWNSLSMDFKLKMLKGITAFKIEVTEIEAKNKLSQNKTYTERQNIVNSFSKSDDANEREIAAYMKDII